MSEMSEIYDRWGNNDGVHLQPSISGSGEIVGVVLDDGTEGSLRRSDIGYLELRTVDPATVDKMLETERKEEYLADHPEENPVIRAAILKQKAEERAKAEATLATRVDPLYALQEELVESAQRRGPHMNNPQAKTGYSFKAVRKEQRTIAWKKHRHEASVNGGKRVH